MHYFKMQFLNLQRIASEIKFNIRDWVKEFDATDLIRRQSAITPVEEILDRIVTDNTLVFLDSMKKDLRNFLVDKLVIEWNKFSQG